MHAVVTGLFFSDYSGWNFSMTLDSLRYRSHSRDLEAATTNT